MARGEKGKTKKLIEKGGRFKVESKERVTVYLPGQKGGLKVQGMAWGGWLGCSGARHWRVREW